MTTTADPNEFRMGLMDHLRELRRRLLICLLVVLVGAVASYSYAAILFDVLCKPFFAAFPGSPLIGTAPAEAWFLKLKVSAFAGTIVTAPILFYQLWRFISPGLYHREKSYVIPFVFLSTLLFCLGAYFCYAMVLPLSLAFFFEEFRSIGVTPTIKLSDHLSMTVTTILAFGLVFELPLLSLFLARAGVLTHKTLLHYFRHAIVAIFVIAAVLTPPDVLSQLLMAGPLIVLFLISIAVAYIATPRTALIPDSDGSALIQGDPPAGRLV